MSKPRFGPEREAALSLDALPVDIPEAEPEFRLSIDWRAIAKTAKLTRLEARVLMHLKHDVPRYRLPVMLHCTPAQAKRAYEGVLSKLRIAGPAFGGAVALEPMKHSLHPAFQERFYSGGRAWALGAWGAEYAHVMYEEKYSGLISQQDAETFRKSPVFYPRMLGATMSSKVESIDISTETEAARQQSSALNRREQELRRELDDLRTRWWNGKQGKPDQAADEAKRVKIEQAVAAILRGEEPDPAILGLESLEAQIGAVLRKLEIIRPSVIAAAQRFNELRAKEQAATDARVCAQVKPEIKEARRMYDELAEFCREKIFGPMAATSSGFDVRPLFDDTPSATSYALWNLFCAAVSTQNIEMYSGPRAVELRRRRGLNDNGTRKVAAA